jgi:hypothetical protein
MKQESKLTPKGAKIVAVLERFRDAIAAAVAAIVRDIRRTLRARRGR